MSSVEYYEEQAARCRKDAEAAPLANVRDRLLQSAITWEAMADRKSTRLNSSHIPLSRMPSSA